MTMDMVSRVRRLEDLVGIGTFGAGIGDLREDVDRLENLVNRSKAENELGNLVVGGPIRTEISHSAFTTGPFREDLDSSFPIGFDLWVPDYLLRIVRCQCRLKPVPIRNSLKVVQSSGTLTSGSNSAASSSGGGDVTGGASNTSSSGASTASTTATNPEDDTGAPANTSITENADGTVGSHSHGLSGHNHDLFVHSHGMGHTHTINHTHIGGTHTHPIPHTHDVAGHTHNVTLGISEGGTATGLRFTLDGVDRSAVLGGPWNAAAVFDITPYLLNVRGEPVAGAHPVSISATAVGAVEVWFDWLVIAKPNV